MLTIKNKKPWGWGNGSVLSAKTREPEFSTYFLKNWAWSHWGWETETRESWVNYLCLKPYHWGGKTKGFQELVS